jgi:acetylcholinesterase
MAAILPTRRLKLIGTFFIITVGILILWLRRNEFGGNPSPEMPVKSAPRPKVTLRQGTVVGIEVKGSFPQRLEEFLGIPYALPTDSERRFRPPVRLNASAVEIDGGGYGHRCPAGTGGSYGEDCLNVNIFRWKIRGPEKKLPVLVYVHGGAFNSGAGNAREISSLVAWSAEPFIGVSFNYRTGAFGFLSSKLAAKEGILNVGLKDQHLLFEWVRDNIAEFGGNPVSLSRQIISRFRRC